MVFGKSYCPVRLLIDLTTFRQLVCHENHHFGCSHLSEKIKPPCVVVILLCVNDDTVCDAVFP